MADKWIQYKKCDDFRVMAPQSVIDAVEIKSIAENGIFEVGKGGIFTKVYMFSDINFETASIDEQIMMLEAWCRWLNARNESFKITFNNKNMDMIKFRQNVLFNHRMDVFDDLRDMFNEIIDDKISENREGVEQELYITISCKNFTRYEDAKTYFNTLETSMERNFTDIGSTIRPLNARERLRIIHDVYRFGREEEFRFDFRDMLERAWDFKECIAPSRLDFTVSDKYFMADDKYFAAIYIKNYPSELSDRYLTELFSLNIKMIGTIDVSPISRADVDKRLKELYMGVQRSIKRQGKAKLKEKDFDSEISYPVQMEQDTIKELINDVNKKEQHMFWTNVIIIVMADTLQKLENDVELVKSRSRNSFVIMDNLYNMQKEALNTVLPIGVKQVDVGIPLETKSIVSLFPFRVQELMVPGGNWYGINKVSKNLCIGNRKKLVNGNGFIIGVTGSGKTAAAQMDAMQNFLKAQVGDGDDVIIIDPKGNFGSSVSRCQGLEVMISALANYHFNPLAYHRVGSTYNIADEKAEIVFAILAACKKEPLTAIERSVANRCLKLVYKNSLLGIEDDGIEEKTLTDLYYEFDNIINDSNANDITIETAENLKLYMELFVTGSLNIFAHKNNVDFNNRMICFNTSQLGKELRELSMLIMLEFIKERVKKNYVENRATWLYIDEIHELFNYDETKVYLSTLWKELRSFGVLQTGITQNVGDLLEDNLTMGMLENSEFIMIFKQKDVAYDKLVSAIGISPEQVKYITSEAGSGRGLLKCGSIVVPFDMQIPKDTELYDIINTNPHEKFAATNG